MLTLIFSPMKSKIAQFIILTLAVSLLPLNTAFADFSDLDSSNKNYKAITFLQEAGILTGYSDGTFRPNQSVNRAEFLKIVLEGSSISLNKHQKTPFTDVDHSQWYAPYIRKAHAEGWVEGYSDGTFHPNQTINKVEALKIIGAVQEWQLPEVAIPPFTDVEITAWYAPYVTYAQKENLIEEVESTYNPGQLMTRSNIAEVIYRSGNIEVIAPKEAETNPTEPNSPTEPTTPAAEPVTTKIKEEPEEQLNFNPVTYKGITTSFYSSIELTDRLPNIFYTNEFYIVEGDLTTTESDYVTAFYEPSDTPGKDIKALSIKVTDKHFKIPVNFPKSGNYNFGIIPGKSGKSKVEKISVLPSLPKPSHDEISTNKVNSLDINFANNKTQAKFDNLKSTIKKITFSQNNKSISYLSRQDIDYIDINYSDFEDFSEGQVNYQISTADLLNNAPLLIKNDFVSSTKKTFTATTHTFSTNNPDQITTTLPETKSNPSTIFISGTVKTDTNLKALVTKPNGFIEEVTLTTNGTTGTYFGATIIKSGSDFQFSYTPQTNGTYIIEINNSQGIATVNHPIYINNGIPLIPDFFDINTRIFFKDTVDLAKMRQELLDKINASRKNHGLNPVALSSKLNSLAQAHTDDMKNSNYFGHINLQNQTPAQRAQAAGITTAVSENIAQDVSVPYVHEGFMRSAAHRNNVLTPDWTLVGLGITQKDGYLLIGEEFSTTQNQVSSIEDYKSELLKEISQIRTTPLTYNLTLENISQDLNNKIIQEQTPLTNSIFSNTLETYKIGGSSQAIGRNANSWSTILSSIINEDKETLTAIWNHIGIDIQIDSNGNLHTILILNQQ